MLVSSIHQHESAIGTYTSPPSGTSLPLPTPNLPSGVPQHWFELPEKYSKFPLAAYFTCGNVCDSTLLPPSLPPPPSHTVITSLFSMSASPAQFSSVTQLCPTLYDPMDCSTPGFLVRYQLLEPAQTHVHWVGDVIQPSHPLSSPSPPAFNLSQHQGLSQWVSFSHQVAKVLELQLQHQSFQWIFRTDFL